MPDARVVCEMDNLDSGIDGLRLQSDVAAASWASVDDAVDGGDLYTDPREDIC